MTAAGAKGGPSYGATGEFGRRAEQNPATTCDLCATVLHILGLDHTQLTHCHNSLARRLTGVHGKPIRQVLKT
jgi:hypothetical protein